MFMKLYHYASWSRRLSTTSYAEPLIAGLGVFSYCYAEGIHRKTMQHYKHLYSASRRPRGITLLDMRGRIHLH